MQTLRPLPLETDSQSPFLDLRVDDLSTCGDYWRSWLEPPTRLQSTHVQRSEKNFAGVEVLSNPDCNKFNGREVAEH